MTPIAEPRRIPVAIIAVALRSGWADFRALLGVSMGFAACFVFIGLGLIAGLIRAGLAPMVPPLIGGFMIFGPVTLAGFMALQACRRRGQRATLGIALGAMRHAGRPLWVLGAFCVFLVLIWLTDAGTLYSFMVGKSYDDWWLALPTAVGLRHFHGGAAVMGGGLAAIVYAVCVHAVPLLVRGQGTLVTAVTASVKAIGRSLLAHLAWALVLSVSVMASIYLLPALLVVLPVMAYASARLTAMVFPKP